MADAHSPVNPKNTSAVQPVLIIYDDQCDFCSAYTKLLRLQAAVGPVELLSARADDARIAFYESQAYDLDAGMLVITAAQVHAGADAIHWLAIHSTDDRWHARLQAAVFRRRWCARALYPLLSLGRRVWLVLRGRSPIRTQRQRRSN